jgi:hypothetical protein
MAGVLQEPPQGFSIADELVPCCPESMLVTIDACFNVVTTACAPGATLLNTVPRDAGLGDLGQTLLDDVGP